MFEDWTFDHVGLVVKDACKTIEYYQAMNTPVAKLLHDTGGKYKTGSLRKGDLTLQFVQPMMPSLQEEFLRIHGEGIDHMCYVVNDLEKERTKLIGMGISLVPAESYPRESDYESILFETRQNGTIMLELRQKTGTDLNVKNSLSNDWQFDHLAFVVDDVYKSLIFYMYLGFEVQLRSRVPKGVPVAAFCRKGPVTLMFHGHQDWHQGKLFYNTHGEGIDHIAFNVTGIEKEASILIKQGYPQKGKTTPDPEAYRAFFDTSRYGGVYLELTQPRNNAGLWWEYPL